MNSNVAIIKDGVYWYRNPDGTETKDFAAAQQAWKSAGYSIQPSGDAVSSANSAASGSGGYESALQGSGNQWLGKLSDFLNNPGKSIDTNPVFQWEKQKGLEAVNRAAAANGQLGSGNRMMALSDYAQKQSGNNFYTLADLYSKLGQNQQGNIQNAAKFNLDQQGLNNGMYQYQNNFNWNKTQYQNQQDAWEQVLNESRNNNDSWYQMVNSHQNEPKKEGYYFDGAGGWERYSNGGLISAGTY